MRWWWFRLTAVLPVLAGAVAFYAPALRRTGGVWPAPLDDVYIHFAFARSAALGHFSTWIPGNGYSSGGTSLVYPLVLAPGWLVGFRGAWLGLFAALVACVCLVDLIGSARALLDPGAGPSPRLDLGPRPAAGAWSARWIAWIAWSAPLVLLAVPLLDWSFFSGMEIALLGVILGRALVAVRRCEHAAPADRPRAQLRAGLWAALLVATRPELAVLSGALALGVAHAAGAANPYKALARAAVPTAALVLAQAALNRALTGEWGAAGAVRKLITSNPYLTPLDAALEVARNLLALRVQALESALGGPRVAWILPLLGLCAALDRRSRRLGLALLVGAYGALLLACLNATARFQNLRYAAPTLLMLLLAALLGAVALARRGRAASLVAAALLGVASLAPSVWFGRQIDHFARASANIVGQQVEVARRLDARVPRPRRVFLNDAGAIPYLSGLPALDGLGLGGYRGMPFARASVHGVPAVVELIERLDPAERPDVMALYPGWWGGLVEDFGRRVDAVTIEDNVICGAAEKVIYEADWSALGAAPSSPGSARGAAGAPGPRVIDEIDVGDLISEKEHGYAIPAPRGGWSIGAVLEGAPEASGGRRFDAGRVVPEGREESFVVAGGASSGPARLLLRTDGGGPVAIEVLVGGKPPGEGAGRGGDAGALEAHRVEVAPRPEGRWHAVEVSLQDVGRGDRVRIRAVRGAWRSFHAWLLR